MKEEAHKEDIEVITQVLAKITTLSPEQIKPYLDTMLERLESAVSTLKF